MTTRNSAVRTALSGVLAAFVVTGTAAGEASIQERLATASAERGQKVFRKCGACHSIDEGTAHTIGPNLWGVAGGPVAAAEGYDRYTPAMTSFGGTWTPERLDRYLRQPMAEVEGTTMVFPGVPNAGDRADLIAWLNRNSRSPLDLASTSTAPKGKAPTDGMADAAEATTPRPVQPSNLGMLVSAEGAEETHAYCTACHSERIVAQQGLTRADWEELLVEMIEDNGMNPIEESDLGRVLGYLATHYGPDRPNFPRP